MAQFAKSLATFWLFWSICFKCSHAVAEGRENKTAKVFEEVHQAYRILVLTPSCSKSHIIAYAPLLNELTARGHHVTAMVPYSVPDLDPAIEILTDDKMRDAAWAIFQYQFSESIGTLWQAFLDELAFVDLAIDGCPKLLKTPTVQNLIKRAKPGTFDFVLITSHMSNECMFGFVNKLKVPFGYFFSAGDQPWSSGAVGNPFPTSFVPYLGATFGDRMTFAERLLNSVLALTMNWKRQKIYSTVEPLVRSEFGLSASDPTISELEANASLVLLNQDPRLFQYPAPNMPNMVGIGGAHCRSSRPLPPDIQSWVEDGARGFIFFSLGSAVSADNFPPEKRRIFAEAFLKIRHKFGLKVLWKWDGTVDEILAKDPKGFKVQKWISQQDILGHGQIKLFITHGGLLSSQEATFHGVPILGIPVGADQMMNLKRISDWGAGRTILWRDITVDLLVEEISELIKNPSYKEKAKERSTIMKDIPIRPEENGAFMVEYVIRHKGAPQLQSHGRFLPWWQYHMVDVWILILSVLAVLFALVILFVKLLMKCFKLLVFRGNPGNSVGSENKKSL